MFEHGHLPCAARDHRRRVSGHHHPSVNFNDGSGTRLRLPSLVVERSAAGASEIFLPAFSPWAGGTRYPGTEGNSIRQWACSPQRVFEVIE